MDKRFALVSHLILEAHQIVDLNVSLTRNVRKMKLVLIKNVEILVQAHAVSGLDVMLLVIAQSVVALQDKLAIRLSAVNQ